MVEIAYLADHPETVPALAVRLAEEWVSLVPEMSTERRRAMLEGQLHRDRLPIAWVALEEGRPVGTAALRVRDLEDRPELTPWLGAMWVDPARRGRGIGRALCAAVEEKAAALGHRSLYLATAGKEGWYASLGWEPLEELRWRDLCATVMVKRL